jgi:hypothetical protein
VANFAGALAKPAWVLLPFIPDWRWLLDRDDSPWYPTVQLFRQDATCAWNPVLHAFAPRCAIEVLRGRPRQPVRARFSIN